MLNDFDGLTLNKIKDLASKSKTDDDYCEAHSDGNSDQDAEEKEEGIPSHIYEYKGK